MVETCSLVSESMRAKRRWSYRSRPYICRLFGQRSCFGKLRIRPIARIPERRLNIRTVKDSRERKEMSCFNHTRLFNLNSTDRTRFFKITNLFSPNRSGFIHWQFVSFPSSASFIFSTYSSKMSRNRPQDFSGMVIAVRKLVFT